MTPRLVILPLLLLAIGGTTAAATAAQDDPPTMFERFFDAIIQGVLKKKAASIEPYHIEELEFDVQPTFRSHKLPPKLEIHATNNTLHGLSTIHRSGHAAAAVQQTTRITTAEMAVGPILDTSDLTITFLGLTLRPQLELSIQNLDFTIAIFGDKVAKKLETREFTIHKMENLRIQLKTRYLPDRLNNRILNRIVPILERKVRKDIEAAIRSHIDDRMQDLPEELKKLLYG